MTIQYDEKPVKAWPISTVCPMVIIVLLGVVIIMEHIRLYVMLKRLGIGSGLMDGIVSGLTLLVVSVMWRGADDDIRILFEGFYCYWLLVKCHMVHREVFRMTEKPIYNVVNGLKYICDETVSKTTYDEENSTIRMTRSDWEEFKKEVGLE